MSYMKGVRPSSEGNASLLKQYGGGSSGGKHADAKGYATGGAVKGGNPSLGEGLSAAGGPSKPSLARPGRKMPGAKKASSKGGKGKTNINIVVMSPKGDDKPMPPMADAGGPPMMPPGPPGGPPMPMRASGGRVKRQDGGSTISEDSKKESKRLRDEAGGDVWKGIAGSAAGTGAGLAALARKKGPGLLGLAAPAAGLAVLGKKVYDGANKASEARRIEEGKVKPGEEDRKHGGKVCRAPGGPVGGLANSQGGSGGASGRLAKVRMYGK